MTDDEPLIEDYLPIEAINNKTSREKSVRKEYSPRCTFGGRGGHWRRAGRLSIPPVWPDPADELCPQSFRAEVTE